MEDNVQDMPNTNSTRALFSFEGVSKFKSVFRAIKRGKVSLKGTIYPNRPFNNRKPTNGRHLNEIKKKIYGQLKQRGIQ